MQHPIGVRNLNVFIILGNFIGSTMSKDAAAPQHESNIKLTAKQLKEDCNKLKQSFLRRKLLTTDDRKEGDELHRCLTVVDLVSLGIGSCCGSGMYIVTGFLAKSVAGPAVILSFLFGGFASILSGECALCRPFNTKIL
jgi:amino acid permease